MQAGVPANPRVFTPLPGAVTQWRDLVDVKQVEVTRLLPDESGEAA